MTSSSTCAPHMLQHHSHVLEIHLLPLLHDHLHLVVSPCNRRGARCPHTSHAMQPGLKLHHALGTHRQEGHCWPLPRTVGTQSQRCHSHVPALSTHVHADGKDQLLRSSPVFRPQQELHSTKTPLNRDCSKPPVRKAPSPCSEIKAPHWKGGERDSEEVLMDLGRAKPVNQIPTLEPILHQIIVFVKCHKILVKTL